jgi:hypothetical protein
MPRKSKVEQPDHRQQITFTLRGADAVDFQTFKRNQLLTKDAEAAQKLVRERLAQLNQPPTEAAA